MKLRVYAGDEPGAWGAALNPLVSALVSRQSALKAGVASSWWQQLPCRTAFDHYNRIAPDLFELTDLDSCDIAVLPADWNRVRGGAHWFAKPKSELLERSLGFAAKVKQSGKPLAVLFSGDCSHEVLPFRADYVFRNSIFRSRRVSGEFAWPGFVEDFCDQYLDGRADIRRKSTSATVGFCGYARRSDPIVSAKTAVFQAYSLAKFGKTNVNPYRGADIRARVISNLKRSNAVRTNTLTYDRRVLFDRDLSAAERRQNRRDYIQNMVDSDYVLCTMGSGNYSLRLFETLSCGRIPLFVDTDCVMPYDFKVDWRDYFLWVDQADIPHIAERVADFHNEISPSEFVDRQIACRELWLNWLSADGFFRHLHRHLKPIRYEACSDADESPLAVSA